MSAALMQQAEQDLDALYKLSAARTPGSMAWKEIRTLAMPLLGTLAAVGATGLASYYFARKDQKQHKDELQQSMKALYSKSEAFKANPEKFVERFGELTVISPTVAKNPGLAAKVLEKKINSGFSVDDVHKLTAIEHNATVGRSGWVTPLSAARASAGATLGSLVTTFGPGFMQQQAQRRAQFERELAGYNSAAKGLHDRIRAMDEENMSKESSAQKVSDECLGAMLAERYVMLKTAGLGDALLSGAKSMGKGLAYFAPALAIGGGLELLRQTMEAKRTAALEEIADKNFSMIMRKSDRLDTAEKKEAAREAFATLKAIAPSLAARPMVAQTFIENTAHQGVLDIDRVTQLAEAENKVRGLGGKSQFFQDLQQTMAFQNPGTIKGIDEVGKGSAGRKGGYKPKRGGRF